MDDAHWMKEALAEAEAAAAIGEVPVGAVILFEDEIIARAHNLRESTKDPLAHAEILALRAAAQKLDGLIKFAQGNAQLLGFASLACGVLHLLLAGVVLL